MQDNNEQHPEIYHIPFETILEANDIELLREYVQLFSIYFGHAVVLKKYDLIAKELKKRTANLDIIEEARSGSAEKALLIGNYCGILTFPDWASSTDAPETKKVPSLDFVTCFTDNDCEAKLLAWQEGGKEQ